jgi:hypothetical protein
MGQCFLVFFCIIQYIAFLSHSQQHFVTDDTLSSHRVTNFFMFGHFIDIKSQIMRG